MPGLTNVGYLKPFYQLINVLISNISAVNFNPTVFFILYVLFFNCLNSKF